MAKKLFETSGFTKMYPQTLNPGEAGVLTISGSNSEAVLSDNALNHELQLVPSHVEKYPVIVRFPVTFAFSHEKTDMPWSSFSVDSEVINIVESPVNNFGRVAVIRDGSGLQASNAIWVGRNYNFNQAIHFF
jgi:hypothetical protein